MLKCGVCGCSDFYKASGYFFCTTCQTQSQDVGEEVELELPVENTARLRKTKIYRAKSDKADDVLGWTSWELYNFVLIGLTNELIELGITADIKLTVLQLWARYLGKLEIAFMSAKKKLIPKLARRYKKRDADIIYGKVLTQKRARKRRKTGSSLADSTASTYPNEEISLRELNRNKKLMITADYDRFIQSQAQTSSEADVLSTFGQSVYSAYSSVEQCKSARIQFNSSAKEETNRIKNMAKRVSRSKRNKYKQSHVTTRYKTGPELITPTKLWAILYLALRIHNQNIHLSDMIRYGREGHLSYYKLDRLVPPEVSLTRSDMNFLSRVMDITHKGMRKIIGRMAKFLGVTKIICPNLLSLVNRYCTELALPKGISSYAERLINLSVPKMTFDKKSCIPNYEGRAMAFIIVVLKTLLSLDGITEDEISNVTDKINRYIMQCQCENFNTPCILVHGGVGNFHDALIIEKTTSCKNAASTGYQSLLSGASSVQAVEIALWWLECDEFFNCGYGSVLNNIGDIQMDASIVDGFKSKCGSVAAISDIEHPISLARYVLDNFPNSIVVGEGARKLTEYAKLNWLSKGNMTAPMAIYLACDKSKGISSFDINLDIENHQSLEILGNSGNTVGCIAYDGYAIAAGVTSGGLNKKIVGSVGDSSILGCSIYANQNVGCSLTGHGESIMKLGLSRVIASDIEEGCSLRKALKKNLDYISTRYNHNFGGVVFNKSGQWDMYFTSHKMPYAVIMDDCVTFGATLDEKNIEKYAECRKHLLCNCHYPLVNNITSAINDEGICDTKLFNFREWQKYIECRKAVLINMHCPTKLKYNPDIPDVNSLYIKFLGSIGSTIDREEPEISMHKHLIPRDLVYAMKQCITNVNCIDLSLNEVNEFSPTITPNHSYLQQLLEYPLYDLPSMLRNDFTSAKSGHLTKSNSINKLASQYDIRLDAVDSNVHFIEKIVSVFEQPKIASVKDLKDDNAIEDFMEEDIRCVERKENFTDYLHKKIPCQLKIDVKKRQFYDDFRNKPTNMCVREKSTSALASASANEFIFNEILPDGKLSISSRCPDDDESKDDDICLKGIVPEQTELSLFKFCKTYNIILSSTEKKAIFNDLSWPKKRKRKLIRNEHGKFIKQNDTSLTIKSTNKSIDKSTGDRYAEETDIISADTSKSENTSEIFDLVNSNTNASVFDNFKIESGYVCDTNQSEKPCKALESIIDESLLISDKKPNSDDILRLCRPFKDYWMYHCNFSRVKPKNFELLEKMLPRSFRWLLDEGASIVEMSTKDLYEEVCLVEAYYAYVLEQSKIYSSGVTSKTENCNNRAYINAILKKW